MSLGNRIPTSPRTSYIEKMSEILRQAVREELIRCKKLGHSVSEWRDGRVVIVPPEEIPFDDEPPEKT